MTHRPLRLSATARPLGREAGGGGDRPRSPRARELPFHNEPAVFRDLDQRDAVRAGGGPSQDFLALQLVDPPLGGEEALGVVHAATGAEPLGFPGGGAAEDPIVPAAARGPGRT